MAVMLAAAFVVNITGCSNNNEQVSSEYQKLPPAEAKRRLQETLKKRGQAKDLSQPPHP